jgi:hypothetical protein
VEGPLLTRLTPRSSRLRRDPQALGTCLISTCCGGWTVVWEAETGAVIRRLPQSHVVLTTAAMWDPIHDRDVLIAETDDHDLLAWDIKGGPPLATFGGHSHSITALRAYTVQGETPERVVSG